MNVDHALGGHWGHVKAKAGRWPGGGDGGGLRGVGYLAAVGGLIDASIATIRTERAEAKIEALALVSLGCLPLAKVEASAGWFLLCRHLGRWDVSGGRELLDGIFHAGLEGLVGCRRGRGLPSIGVNVGPID